MGRDMQSFLDRYAILGAAISLFGFAVVLLFRLSVLGVAAIIGAVVMVLLAVFLFSVYVRNKRDELDR